AIAIAPTLPALNCTFVNTAGFQSATCTGFGTLFAALGIWWLVALIVSVGYFVGMWSWQGQTLGQKLLGLHVVDAFTGTRISIGRAVIRYIGIIVSAWVLYIGLIWAAFDAQKQGWHDKMASTFVVQRV
ncbi:MAG TPA: RDD family protein, partial [Candidatus Dormibacteraeota bacterium]